MQIAFHKTRYSGIHDCPLCGETLVTNAFDPADPLMQIAYCPNRFCAAERVSLRSDDGTLHCELITQIEDFLLEAAAIKKAEFAGLLAGLKKGEAIYWLAHDLTELVEEVINGWLEPTTENKELEVEK